MTLRLLITGGAGCLGSSLVEHHLALGAEVWVIDNFVTGARSSLTEHTSLTVVEASIADQDAVRSLFQDSQPTHVIHAAASYKDPDNWYADATTNVLGAINVARSSAEVGVERLINLQTALCYGRPIEVPIPVDHPLAPFTSYGISKTAGESCLLNADVDVVSLRLANICGPRLAIGPLPTFYKRLTAGQDCFATEAVRDFIDMEDFLRIVDVVLDPSSRAGVYNVSSGEGHSIIEVLRAVSTELGTDVSDVVPQSVGADDVPQVVLDPSLTQERLGWRTEVGFTETIRRQVQWYRDHGVGNVFSHLADPRVRSGRTSSPNAPDMEA